MLDNPTYTEFYQLYLGLVDDGEIQLLPMPREHSEDQSTRFKLSTYNNWSKKAIEIYLGYVLNNSTPRNESDLPVDIQTLARNAATDALVGGRSYIYTTEADGPVVYGLNQVNPEASGSGDISALRIPGPNGTLNITITGHNGGFVEGTVSQDTGEDGQDPIEPRPLEPGELIEVSWNKYKRSLLWDVSSLALQIYNLESIKDYNTFKLGYQFEYGPRLDDSKSRPNYGAYLPLMEGAATPGSSTVGDIESIRKLEESIGLKVLDFGRALGLEVEFAEEIKLESGRAKQYSLIDINARVNAISASVGFAVNQSLQYFAALKGVSIDTIGIKLETELKPDMVSDNLRDLRALADFVNTPEVRKWAAKQMVLSMAKSIPHSEQKELTTSIDKLKDVSPYNNMISNQDFTEF